MFFLVYSNKFRMTQKDCQRRWKQGIQGPVPPVTQFWKKCKKCPFKNNKNSSKFCIFIQSKTWKKFFMDCVKHATFNTAGGRDFKICLWEIGSLLVNKFSRETDFSNKLFRISHQGRMPWKLAGATNLCLQINLIFSIVANVVLHSYI